MAATILAVALMGCQNEPDAALQTLPEGSMRIGESLYAVPLAERDADGCQPYRLHSPDRMVVQALHYRRPDGSFTINKLEAACTQGRDG